MKGDIVEELRNWSHAVLAEPASDLMDRAADEIVRLRGLLEKSDTAGRLAVTLMGDYAEKAGWYEGGMSVIALGFADPMKVARESMERYKEKP